MRSLVPGLVMLALAVSTADAAGPRELLARARQLYNAGRYDEAIEGITRWVAHDDDSPWAYAWQATAYSRSGRPEEARRALEKLDQVSASRADRVPTLLVAYSGTGQNGRVLDLLQRAYSEHSNAVVKIKVDPMYDPIRGDPRFQDLLKRLGLER